MSKIHLGTAVDYLVDYLAEQDKLNRIIEIHWVEDIVLLNK
jgi:hypothetical protein